MKYEFSMKMFRFVIAKFEKFTLIFTNILTKFVYLCRNLLLLHSFNGIKEVCWQIVYALFLLQSTVKSR